MNRTVLSRTQTLATFQSRRTIQTESITPDTELELLNKQRLNRPSSPHFTIYQPQVTWLGSIAHRVTGAGLSVGFYTFFLAYLAAPVVGIPLDAGHVVEFFHSWPEWALNVGKVVVALPFSFHTFNGMRHLAWDSGKFLTVKGAYSTWYAVLGASVLSTGALLML